MRERQREKIRKDEREKWTKVRGETPAEGCRGLEDRWSPGSKKLQLGHRGPSMRAMSLSKPVQACWEPLQQHLRAEALSMLHSQGHTSLLACSPSFFF